MSEFGSLLFFLTLFFFQEALVLALVELSKKFVPPGNYRVLASFVIGLLIGALCLSFGYAELADYALHQQIPIAAFFLLIAGLSASGFYDLRPPSVIPPPGP